MSFKKLDDLRVELGLPTKGTHKQKRGDYTNISLHFRMETQDARDFLIACKQLDISESQYARRAILNMLENGKPKS